MQQLVKIWRFGTPFLRPYLPRFVFGVVLGVIFGLSNGLFVLSINVLFKRLSPATGIIAPATMKQEKPGVSLPFGDSASSAIKEKTQKWGEKAQAVANQWLPAVGQPFAWKQAAGGFLLLPLVVGLRSLTNYLSVYLLTWVSTRVIRDMQLAALRKVQELSVAFFQKRPVSDLVARINGDTRVIYTAMTTGFIDTIREPFSLLGILASMLWVDWKLTLISLGLLPVIIWPVAKSGRRLKEMAKSFARQNVQQSGGILEALMAVRVVKAYSMEAAQRRNFLELANQTVALNVKQAQIKSMLNPVIEVISMVGIGFLILFVFYTATCPTNFVTFVAALLLTPLSIKRLADLHLTLQTASVSSERLEELFSEQPTVVEPARPQTLTKFSQGICIENVTFSYGHTDVLHKVSLEIPKGKKIGLAGESGSGKSTLINLIMRFYDPTQGRILLDGHDLREYATKDLLAQMGMVSQDVVLFNLPVGKNIGLGHEGATQAEIEQAAKHAYAHDFILQMPQGYESPCGERGQLLSGGQKARIAIARAFVRNAPILVLDEPTAALDSKAEAEIQAAIDSLEQGRTVICIAHRLSTLATMDEIVVLNKGQIVERGTFDQLLKAKGHFARMAEQQRLTASS